MKKRSLILITILCIAVILIISVFCAFTIKKECVFAPDFCELVFECTPDEFLIEENQYSKLIGDLRNSADIDEQGNLVVEMSFVQRNILRGFWNLTMAFFADDNPYVDVSAKDNKVTIYGYCDAEYSDDFLFSLVSACYTVMVDQILDGVPVEEQTLTLIVEDGVTHEIFYSATYPEDPEISLSFEEDMFSPLPK